MQFQAFLALHETRWAGDAQKHSIPEGVIQYPASKSSNARLTLSNFIMPFVNHVWCCEKS
jgi:hypothetical protein